MTLTNVVYVGNGVLQYTEVWDEVAGTYTRMGPTGTVLQTRALTARESAQAAATTTETQRTGNRDRIRTRAMDAIAALTTVAQSSGTLTTAQLSTAARAQAKATIALLRLALDAVDTDDGT